MFAVRSKYLQLVTKLHAIIFRNTLIFCKPLCEFRLPPQSRWEHQISHYFFVCSSLSQKINL